MMLYLPCPLAGHLPALLGEERILDLSAFLGPRAAPLPLPGTHPVNSILCLFPCWVLSKNPCPACHRVFKLCSLLSNRTHAGPEFPVLWGLMCESVSPFVPTSWSFAVLWWLNLRAAISCWQASLIRKRQKGISSSCLWKCVHSHVSANRLYRPCPFVTSLSTQLSLFSS